MALLNYSRHIAVAVGIVIIVVNLVAALFGPLLAPYPETALIGSVWAPPSSSHLFGLDNLGRDILSRLLYGSRLTIAIALMSTLLAFLMGVTAGFWAALAKPWVDSALSRFVDALMAFPTLILALVILSVMGSSIPILVVTVAAVASTRVFRVSRALARDVVVLDYIVAARLRGETAPWLIFREVLPNTRTALLAEFGLRFCFAVLFIASLSFLGLGIQPPHADWGSMVRENAQAISGGGIAPLIPATAIALLVVGVNLALESYVSTYKRLERRRS